MCIAVACLMLERAYFQGCSDWAKKRRIVNMKRISFLVLVFLLMLTSSVFATKYDYKDETCNLGKLRSAVVDAVISPQGKVQDADITQKLVADICQRLEERCHLRTATMTAVQQRIAAEKEPDFARIAASD